MPMAMVFLVPLDAFFHCAIDEHDVMPSRPRNQMLICCRHGKFIRTGMRIFVWKTVEGLNLDFSSFMKSFKLSFTFLLSSRSSDGEDCLSLLENIPRGDLAISKTYPEPELFFFLSTMLGPQTCFLFVCELVSIRLSDSKWGDSPSAKLKPVKD